MFKQMKGFTVSLAVIIGVLMPQTIFGADSGIKVFFDGQELAYDVPPQIIGGRTMVPLSQTIEAVTGSPAGWNAETRTVTFSANGHTNVHKIGATTVFVDGSPVEFDTPSQIIDSRTLVPVRMIAETSGCKVDWNGGERHVIITGTTTEPTTEPAAEPSGEQQTDDASAPKILEFTTPGGTKTAKGSDFKVNVTTNGAASYVWVEGLGGDAWQGILVDAGNEDGRPKWEVTCYPISDGRMKIYAASGEADTIVAVEMVELAFTDANSTGTQAASDTQPQLLSFTTASGTRLNKGDKFMANVTTNGAALSVWAEGQDSGKWQGELVDAGNEDGMPKWEIIFTPAGSGQVKIYAAADSAAAGVVVKTIDIMVAE